MQLWLIIPSLPVLIVGTGWMLIGVWLILFFASLELGLLSFFMYKVCYKNYRQQQITIAKNHVTVESGINTPSKQHIFMRPDCYLAVNKPTKPIDNLHLMLTGQSEALSIGELLNPTDRETARRSLVSAGLIEYSNRWWNHS
jgi:uncharacterized membrane protein